MARDSERAGCPRFSGLTISAGLLALCGLITQGMASAQEERDEKAVQEAHEIVKKIQVRYEKTKDLQADFTQKTKIEGFATPVVSSGRVYIKKPGRLRWDYVEPSVRGDLRQQRRRENVCARA